MPLTLSHATEEELPEYSRVHAAAFQSMLYRFLYTGPLSESSLAALTRQISEARKRDPNYHVLKVSDDETGEILAFAKWIIYPTVRTEKELDESDSHVPEVLPETRGGNSVQNFFRTIREVKREVIGTRPYCGMHALFETAPPINLR